MVFVGVQPTLMHVPPRFFSSISATDHPKSARRNASGLPAWPEPTTMASYFIKESSGAGAHQDSTLDAAHQRSMKKASNPRAGGSVPAIHSGQTNQPSIECETLVPQ